MIAHSESPRDDNAELLSDTLAFVLGFIIEELEHDIDLRAKGKGRNFLVRFAVYFVALLKDLLRIPTHSARGIGQARFRFRVAYIVKTAIPILTFFLDNYPLREEQRRSIEEAIDSLRKGAGLVEDGLAPVLDGWYATMEEFALLTDCSRAAAAKLAAARGRQLAVGQSD